MSRGTDPRATDWSNESAQGWTLHHYPLTASTNLLAANLGPWQAVRADVQTAGRGRFQRTWVSDEGGLWLSAVLPIGSGPEWRALPLTAGLAVCTVLNRLGVQHLRMRWPNDILVENRKVCGLLLDQFVPGLAVVGIGLNVANRPEARDASLRGQVTRLADLVPSGPSLPELQGLLLSELRSVWTRMNSSGFGGLLPEVNRLWGPPRAVELDLDGQLCQGEFKCVDERGRLILTDISGGEKRFEPHQVRHLREI